jgi:hypothetical protein
VGPQLKALATASRSDRIVSETSFRSACATADSNSLNRTTAAALSNEAWHMSAEFEAGGNKLSRKLTSKDCPLITCGAIRCILYRCIKAGSMVQPQAAQASAEKNATVLRVI